MYVWFLVSFGKKGENGKFEVEDQADGENEQEEQGKCTVREHFKIVRSFDQRGIP